MSARKGAARRRKFKKWALEIVGDATPRAPLSNQLNLGELYPPKRGDEHREW